MARIHFIGIGGAGMAPLARLELERGNQVSGSDRSGSGYTAELATLGATVNVGHGADRIPEGTELVVYSSAIPEDNPERREAERRGLPQQRRGAHLAELARSYRRVAAISGSHGKTSITAMLSFVLERAGQQPGYLVGGSLPDRPSSRAGNGDVFITEADESDATHTLLAPELGIVPNVEDDHEWSLGGPEALRRNFRQFAARSHRLLYYATPETCALFADHPAAIRIDRPLPEFPGYLGVNAALVVKAAELLGVEPETARRELRNWPGVRRRLTVHFESPERTLIEDYAHHPTELAATLEVLRMRYPGHHLRILFQPHRYARLAKYLDAFARELRRADSVLVLPVFAAWSETGPVGAAELAARIGDRARACATLEEAVSPAQEPTSQPLLLALVGAGDLDRLLPELLVQLRRRPNSESSAIKPPINRKQTPTR